MNGYIVITGNPCDGFSFYGPFGDANEAGDWAADALTLSEWWTARLHEKEAA